MGNQAHLRNLFPGIIIMEEQLHHVMNINKTDISVNASKMSAGGRPAIFFHDPHLLLASRSVANFPLACMGIFGNLAAALQVSVYLCTSSCRQAQQPRRGRRSTTLFDPHLNTCSRFGCAEERIWPCTLRMNEKRRYDEQRV